MSAQPQPDAFRKQDGQVLTQPGPEKRPHPQFRWDCRIDRSDWTVRAAWRAGEPRDWPVADQYARVHEPTETILIAEYGCLVTVVHVPGLDSDEDPVKQYAEADSDE